MNNRLIQDILSGKSVRRVIEEHTVTEGPLSDLADAMEYGSEESDADDTVTVQADDDVSFVGDDDGYRHLFIRRFHAGEDKPYKRVKVNSALEALQVFFEFIEHYKKDRCEIWTDVADDAKSFYRFCVKNRQQLETLWKASARMKRESKLFPAAYRDIQARSRQSGTNLIGTLYPFDVPSK